MIDRLDRTLAAIDEVNKQDPNTEIVDGKALPKEWVYGIRMSENLAQFDQPSEVLQIACRGQHIKRWAIPRSDFPMDRPGYLKWRTQLKVMHGELVAGLMKSNGYNEEEISYAKDLLMKKNLKKKEEVQTLEDVACLVFLNHHIGDFATGKDESKLIDIIQKTWKKMSSKGHDLAMKLPYTEPVLVLIKKALA